METTFRNQLKLELEKRQDKNPRYTLRAFARDLELSAPRLSEVLNGKKGLSSERARTIAKSLGWSKSETEHFVTLVESECARALNQRNAAKEELRKYELPRDTVLTLDLYRVISEWYHFAILALTERPDFEANPKWISARLEISIHQASQALERLFELGMIEGKNGKIVATQDHYHSPDGIPSEALRKHHEGLLQKAITSLYSHSLQERDFYEATFSIDEKDFPEIQKQIRTLFKTVLKKFSNPKNPTRVMSLGTHFFPLDLTLNKEPQS